MSCARACRASDLIVFPGLINLDFADVKAIMSGQGAALMGIGFGNGDTRAADAARDAVASPLLETTIAGAKGILLNVTGGPDLTLYEVNEAAQLVSESADPDAQIIFGTVIDDRMQGEIKVTVIATGFTGERVGQMDVFAGEEDATVPAYEPSRTPVAASPREKEAPPTFDSEGPRHPGVPEKPPIDPGLGNAAAPSPRRFLIPDGNRVDATNCCGRLPLVAQHVVFIPRGAWRLKCPYCGHEELKVVDSRDSETGEAIRRRRECLACHKRFTTYERVENIPFYVIKKDGRREDFNRQKMFDGLMTACEKRDVSPSTIESTIDEIESTLRASGKMEIPSGEIGELVMEHLRRIDDVAYVRFASVYRQFRDLTEVKKEIDQLLSKQGIK